MAPDPSALAVEAEIEAAGDRPTDLGMFVFLASESMLFAGMFALYAAGRIAHPHAFARGVAGDLGWIGATNTYLLLISSWCIATAVARLRAGERRRGLIFTAATMLLGAAFLGLKAYEYAHHLAAGEGPGAPPPAGQADGIALFHALYWLMTGTHALHVIAGLALLGWMSTRILRGRSGAGLLELGAWYWHLVDLMWIFLWPLFYLLGRP